ncbi:MAG: glycosyltransferase [Rubrivivax sp. SCN 70-15]|nr:MAG: glycosyltransferase [Rubrivivax sp. SCN 70-15]
MSRPKRLLLIAYHFPPLAGSSGIQRTLRFVQHLPKFGWEPIVLTVHPRAYELTRDDLNGEVSTGTIVRRAFALDAARHLSVKGRYVAGAARPDRWMSWRFDGVRQGMKLIRDLEPQVIWSTYPIATAHVIGADLHAKTGLPWIADFRDPMAQDGYPADPATWRQYADIERTALLNAARSVFTTPGAAREYARRYPDATDRIAVIENGYDEETFRAAEVALPLRAPLEPGCLSLLHSGIVYPSERDPTHLMRALQILALDGRLAPGRLKILFRASSHDGLLAEMAAQHGVAHFIELMPPIGYRDALTEMLRADALLVLQASNCNDQIPAKVYEYLRARRPIVALTDPSGDTGQLLLRSGISSMARLDDAGAIAELLASMLGSEGAFKGLSATPESVLAASRAMRTSELVGLLDSVRDETQMRG